MEELFSDHDKDIAEHFGRKITLSEKKEVLGSKVSTSYADVCHNAFEDEKSEDSFATVLIEHRPSGANPPLTDKLP